MRLLVWRTQRSISDLFGDCGSITGQLIGSTAPSPQQHERIATSLGSSSRGTVAFPARLTALRKPGPCVANSLLCTSKPGRSVWFSGT